MNKKIILCIKALVSFGLIAVIASRMDMDQLVLSLHHGDLKLLGLAFVFGAVFNLIKFLKWQKLLIPVDTSYSYMDGARSYMIGNALGMVTPMRAGDLGRALYFPKSDRSKIMGLTIVDRLIDLSIVFLLALGGSFILINEGFGILIGVLGILCVYLIYSPSLINKMINRCVPRCRLKEKLQSLVSFLNLLDYKVVTTSLMLGCAAFIIIMVEFFFLVSAFENISLVSIVLVTPLITLSSIMPISLMGFGVREGASVLLLSIFGISATTAVSAAFMFFIFNNFSISIFGAMYLSKVNIRNNC